MGVNGIYGLSGSGMDIESMVKVGMMSKQSEYDKMAQKYTKNEWMKSDYIELSNQITTFNASTLSQYKLSTTMNAKSAESSSSAVKASALSSAPLMTHSVDVQELSANAYLIGTNKLTRYAITDTTTNPNSTKLADVLFKDLHQQVKNGQTYVGGHVASGSSDIAGADTASRTFGGANGVYQEVLTSSDADYNSANSYWQKSDGNGSWTSYDKGFDPTQPAGTAPNRYSYYSFNNGSWEFDQDAYDKALTEYNARVDYQRDSTKWRNVIDKNNTANASINDVAFEFTISDGQNSGTISYTYDELLNGGKTLTDLASDINKLGTNIKASYDVDRDQFTMYNKESGRENKIDITIGADRGASKSALSRPEIAAQNFFTNLGLYKSANGQLTGQNSAAAVTTGSSKNSLLFSAGNTNGVTGDNNRIVIDGVTYEESTNKVSVGGITYTATAIGSSTVTVTQDTDAIVDKVKSFVADYNKLLASLYEKYDEKPNSDYKPLTQSQKDAMKEEQITKWEEKAKAGLLYHDQTIGKIIQNMRSAISTGVEQEDGSTASVFSLGISTTGLKGQLVLDEDKLRKALDKDPDIVYNVLSKPDLDVASKNGVAQKLGDIFTDATKSIKSRAGSTADITEDSDLNNLLRQLQTRMSNFKKMMATYENALYKKYDAMEATLARLGTQLNFVMGGNG